METPIKNLSKSDSEDNLWVAQVNISKNNWLNNVEIEIADTTTSPSQDSLLLISNFIEFLSNSSESLKNKLFEFYNANRDLIAEEALIWDYDMANVSSPALLWETLNNFIVSYEGEFFGGPKIGLLADCDWRPNGGLQFIWSHDNNEVFIESQ